MGIMDTLKDMAFLVQKSDNVELLKATLTAQAEVGELLEEKRRLQEENHQLREQLRLRAEMRFEHNVYWQGEVGPFCPACFGREERAVRMADGPGQWCCAVCNTIEPKPGSRPTLPQPNTRYMR